ncbi:MAG: adenylyl-sulfate kinase, partial [Ilumatobacteraceae bacterium]|nr:adenylyl-sulfate kinase [Ilumatobacteraceae bacterium]
MSNANQPVWHEPAVARDQRWRHHRLHGATLWLTGLSGSGKSTIADAVARELLEASVLAYVLDADNLRHGLNANLGFSDADRSENVRRVGEVARLFADTGIVAIVPIISPFAADRARVRVAHAGSGLDFVEIHVATSLAECERRDAKGLYAKVRSGEMRGVSGVDAPYEAPV